MQNFLQKQNLQLGRDWTFFKAKERLVYFVSWKNFWLTFFLDQKQLFYLQSFENYLTSLLLKPALKESDILYTFLTSDEEFTTEGSNLGLGKMIKNVPIKLTKERGQSLQHFIDSFVMQIQSPPAKPK